jgi:UDP-glucose 4-epimerase
MDSHSDSGASSPRHSHSSSISEFSTLFSPSIEDLQPSEGHYIAIVGGLGYIGSHTCLELLKAGYNIIIIDNLSNSYRSVYDRLGVLAKSHYETRCEPMPEMKLYEADYRDKIRITKILEEYVEPAIPSRFSRGNTGIASKIRGVIHFGAYKSVSESIQEPLKYYANNVAGLIEFCSILMSFNIKTFIFSSSATVYGSLANSGKPLLEEY